MFCSVCSLNIFPNGEASENASVGSNIHSQILDPVDKNKKCQIRFDNYEEKVAKIQKKQKNDDATNGILVTERTLLKCDLPQIDQINLYGKQTEFIKSSYRSNSSYLNFNNKTNQISALSTNYKDPNHLEEMIEDLRKSIKYMKPNEKRDFLLKKINFNSLNNHVNYRTNSNLRKCQSQSQIDLRDINNKCSYSAANEVEQLRNERDRAIAQLYNFRSIINSYQFELERLAEEKSLVSKSIQDLSMERDILLERLQCYQCEEVEMVKLKKIAIEQSRLLQELQSDRDMYQNNIEKQSFRFIQKQEELLKQLKVAENIKRNHSMTPMKDRQSQHPFVNRCSAETSLNQYCFLESTMLINLKWWINGISSVFEIKCLKDTIKDKRQKLTQINEVLCKFCDVVKKCSMSKTDIVEIQCQKTILQEMDGSIIDVVKRIKHIPGQATVCSNAAKVNIPEHKEACYSCVVEDLDEADYKDFRNNIPESSLKQQIHIHKAVKLENLTSLEISNTCESIKSLLRKIEYLKEQNKKQVELLLRCSFKNMPSNFCEKSVQTIDVYPMTKDIQKLSVGSRISSKTSDVLQDINPEEICMNIINPNSNYTRIAIGDHNKSLLSTTATISSTADIADITEDTSIACDTPISHSTIEEREVRTPISQAESEVICEVKRTELDTVPAQKITSPEIHTSISIVNELVPKSQYIIPIDNLATEADDKCHERELPAIIFENDKLVSGSTTLQEFAADSTALDLENEEFVVDSATLKFKNNILIPDSIALKIENNENIVADSAAWKLDNGQFVADSPVLKIENNESIIVDSPAFELNNGQFVADSPAIKYNNGILVADSATLKLGIKNFDADSTLSNVKNEDLATSAVELNLGYAKIVADSTETDDKVDDIKGQKEQIERILTLTVDLRTQKAGPLDELKFLSKEVETTNNLHDECEKKWSQLEYRIVRLRKINDKFLSNIAKLNGENRKLKGDLNDMTNNANNLSNVNETLMDDVSGLTKRLSELERTLQETKGNNVGAFKILDLKVNYEEQIRKIQNNCQNQIVTLKFQYDKLKEDYEKILEETKTSALKHSMEMKNRECQIHTLKNFVNEELNSQIRGGLSLVHNYSEDKSSSPPATAEVTNRYESLIEKMNRYGLKSLTLEELKKLYVKTCKSTGLIQRLKPSFRGRQIKNENKSANYLWRSEKSIKSDPASNTSWKPNTPLIEPVRTLNSTCYSGDIAQKKLTAMKNTVKKESATSQKVRCILKPKKDQFKDSRQNHGQCKEDACTTKTTKNIQSSSCNRLDVVRSRYLFPQLWKQISKEKNRLKSSKGQTICSSGDNRQAQLQLHRNQVRTSKTSLLFSSTQPTPDTINSMKTQYTNLMTEKFGRTNRFISNITCHYGSKSNTQNGDL